MSIETLTNNKAVMFGLAVIAFLVAAVLVIMIFRMLFGGRLRMPGGRSRQARLGIVDAFDLDRQRQLIIVRRDNVEHLIMIGGPNDLVVESEIVRAEAARDLRREPGFVDGRIPAPPPALDKAGPGLPSPEPVQPRAVEDAILPGAPETDGSAMPTAPARAPTFPLPPRRPAPPPAAPERRPAPPPKLPETVSRGDDIPAFSGQPPAPAPAPPQPVPPPAVRPPSPQPAPAAATPPVTPAGPVAAPPTGPSAAPPPSRPPFLKPLPPRPPMRPLQRTTPQPPSDASSGASPASGPTGPSTGLEPPRPAARPMPPKPMAPKPPAPVAPRPAAAPPPAPTTAKAPEEAPDALESLEEEMAKLLGRGS